MGNWKCDKHMTTLDERSTPCPYCEAEKLLSTHYEPVTYTYTKEHMIEYAKQYLEKTYGPVKEREDEDLWFTRLGMLMDFLSGPFPK